MRKIVKTLHTCGGAPRIDGTRLTCADIVTALSSDDLSLSSFFHAYPYVEPASIRECLRYCSQRECEQNAPYVFCSGCTLDDRSLHLTGAETADELDEQRDMWILADHLRHRLATKL